MLYKSLTFLNKSLHFFKNVFKKPQTLSKCPTLMKKTSIFMEIINKKNLRLFEKSSHQFKKASTPLKMFSMKIKVVEKNQNLQKSLKFSENITQSQK
jgi:hypothetical protein